MICIHSMVGSLLIFILVIGIIPGVALSVGAPVDAVKFFHPLYDFFLKIAIRNLHRFVCHPLQLLKVNSVFPASIEVNFQHTREAQGQHVTIWASLETTACDLKNKWFFEDDLHLWYSSVHRHDFQIEDGGGIWVLHVHARKLAMLIQCSQVVFIYTINDTVNDQEVWLSVRVQDGHLVSQTAYEEVGPANLRHLQFGSTSGIISCADDCKIASVTQTVDTVLLQFDPATSICALFFVPKSRVWLIGRLQDQTLPSSNKSFG